VETNKPRMMILFMLSPKKDLVYPDGTAREKKENEI
jgi:hypothetical protein